MGFVDPLAAEHQLRVRAVKGTQRNWGLGPPCDNQIYHMVSP